MTFAPVDDPWGLQEIIKNQTDEIDRLRQRVAELEAALDEQFVAFNEQFKDAERYRWLRDGKHEVRMWLPNGESNRVRAWLSGKKLDASIDAAMESE